MAHKVTHSPWRGSEGPQLCLMAKLLEKIHESPLHYKEIKPVNRKGNQSWTFIGRTDAETEAPILWPPDAKNWLIGKHSDAGKDWRQEEKGMTEDEMVAWYYQLYGHEFEQALGVDDGQGSLACCSPEGLNGLDTTVRLNWTETITVLSCWLFSFCIFSILWLYFGTWGMSRS